MISSLSSCSFSPGLVFTAIFSLMYPLRSVTSVLSSSCMHEENEYIAVIYYNCTMPSQVVLSHGLSTLNILTAWNTKMLSACYLPVTKGHNWHMIICQLHSFVTGEQHVLNMFVLQAVDTFTATRTSYLNFQWITCQLRLLNLTHTLTIIGVKLILECYEVQRFLFQILWIWHSDIFLNFAAGYHCS